MMSKVVGLNVYVDYFTASFIQAGGGLEALEEMVEQYQNYNERRFANVYGIFEFSEEDGKTFIKGH